MALQIFKNPRVTSILIRLQISAWQQATIKLKQFSGLELASIYSWSHINPESHCKLMRVVPKANFKHHDAVKIFFVTLFSSHPNVRKQLRIDVKGKRRKNMD